MKVIQHAFNLRRLAALCVVLLVAVSPAFASPSSGVVRRAVVSLHKYPSTTSECVTQALLNEPVLVKASRAGWLKVELPQQFNYPGWIEASAVELGAAPPSDGVEVAAGKTVVYAEPSRSSAVETEVFMATALAAGTAEAPAGWKSVQLPGGRSGFVASGDVRGLEHASAPSAGAVMATARRYMGTPYLWGGMSVRGVDCSGFTHTVYRLNGIKIHRDADQQFDHDGVPVRSLRDLQPGDLVFFKTYLKDIVSHVGFYLGNGKILEASSRVKGVGISNLSDPYLMKRYAGARRILK